MPVAFKELEFYEIHVRDIAYICSNLSLYPDNIWTRNLEEKFTHMTESRYRMFGNHYFSAQIYTDEAEFNSQKKHIPHMALKLHENRKRL